MKQHLIKMKMSVLILVFILYAVLLSEYKVQGCDSICRNKLKRRLPMAVIVQDCDQSKIQIVDDTVQSELPMDNDNPDDETLREALNELEDDDDEEFEESDHEPKSIYKIISAVLKRFHHVAKRGVKRARYAAKREKLIREAYMRKPAESF